MMGELRMIEGCLAMIGVVLVGMRDDWLGWKVGVDGMVEMVGWTGWMDGGMDNGRSLKCRRSLFQFFYHEAY